MTLILVSHALITVSQNGCAFEERALTFNLVLLQFISGLGRGRMCEQFRQLLAAGRWFPPGTPVSSTRKLISSSLIISPP